MNKITGWIISLVGLIIVYGAINLVLYGGQELWHKGDTDKLHVIEEFLKGKKVEMDSIEQRLVTTETDLNARKSQLDRYKAINDIYHYNLGVDSYNSLLGDYRLYLEQYNNALSIYNQKIDEGNELIKKTGTRWYVIPIPIPSKSIAH